MPAEFPTPFRPDKVSPCPPVLSGHPASGHPASDRPPADGPPVSLADEGTPPPVGTRFVVAYRDERFRFPDGGWARFGRDDSHCQLTVWEELRGSALSRIAGELWCTEGEMWVRNLSYTHELVVSGVIGPPQLLTPRVAGARGRACSVPVPEGLISAPTTGGWQLRIRQVGAARHGDGTADDRRADPAATASVDPVPETLRDVAAALCEPVVLRGEPPANYDEVAAALGISRRHARRRVEQLCDHYRARVPDLLASFTKPQSASYVPVAQLLVDRGRVGREEILRLRRGRGAARASSR